MMLISDQSVTFPSARGMTGHRRDGTVLRRVRHADRRASSDMRRMIRGALVICALAVLSACSTGGNAANPGATPSTMSDAEILAIGKQAAECIRNNGVPDFPDPYVERGKLRLPEEVEQNLESRYSQQVLDQAEQSCKTLMDRIPESAMKGDDGGDDRQQQPGPGDVEALKKFAQCIRENGVPEWPDPKSDGSFPAGGTPLETEGKSDRVVGALRACQQHWSGGISVR